MRSSFAHTEPDGGTSTDEFNLDSVRLYVNGPVTDKIKFMFNTEYDGATNKIGVLDAVARFEMSPKFNIWAGRFLPPSDRANLYGPYYAHHWAVYTDGIQNGYPFVFQGRDNGVAYWGDFGKKVKDLGRRLRRPLRDGQSRSPRGRPRPDRFLGSGGRLLPERHLLRRQEPACHRRGDSGAVRQHGHNRRFPAGKEAAQRRRRFDRKRVCQLQPAGRIRRGPMPRARAPMCWQATSFRNRSASGKFEILGKYAKAEFTHGPSAELSARKPPK